MESGQKPLSVLCLHGYGNNNEVFETQTAALRYELGEGFKWKFVEGSIAVPMDPALHGYFPEEDQYFSYFDLHDAESLAKALQDLQDFVIHEGPFDFIMGSSVGASIIATLLIRNAQESPLESSLFKGAFFFSGLNPFDHTSLTEDKLMFMNPSSEFKIIIPTANIWSATDELKASASPQLAALCNPMVNVNFIHQGAGIPGAGDEVALVGAVHAIRKTVDVALKAI